VWIRSLAPALALIATLAATEAAPQWPPPAGVEARMHELQAVLNARDATPAQRAAAREELAGLLKSPAAQRRAPARDEKPAPPARNAIDPLPRFVRPADNPRASAPPVAQVEIVPPPKPLVVPQTGAVTSPSNRFAVDPRTGAVLHEIPGGYVDPTTGQVVPR
jgi:hypothetical protein